MKSLRKLIGGIALLSLGIYFLTIFGSNAINNFPIWFLGDKITATVDDMWFEQLSGPDENYLEFEYFISYSFIASNGEMVFGSSNLGEIEFGMKRIGGNIDVKYLPSNPNNNRVDDSRYMLLYLCSYIPFLFLLIFSVMTGWGLLSSEFIRDEPRPWEVNNKNDSNSENDGIKPLF